MSRDPQLFLEDILDAGSAIFRYTRDHDSISFQNDSKTVDATTRRFEIIGEAVKNLSEEWKLTEPGINWHAIAGFRNILAHAYFHIEEEIIWQSVEKDLQPLMDACQRIKQRFCK